MRKNKKRIVPFEDFEKSGNDSNGVEEKYIRIVHIQIVCMGQLSGNAVKLYIAMKDYASGKKEFSFPHKIYKELFSNQTFISARKELIDKGFLSEFTTQAPRKKANVYKFSGEWRNVFASYIKEKTRTKK